MSRRCSSTPSEDSDPGETSCGEAVESTTLHILSPKCRPPSPRELYISESQDEACCGGMDTDGGIHKGPQLLSTRLHLPHEKYPESTTDDVLMSFSPGNVVELQVSLAKSTLDDTGIASIGNTCETDAGFSNKEPIGDADDNPQQNTREPLSHHGVVLNSPAVPGQVEVILQGEGRGARSEVGGPKISSEAKEEEEETSQEVPKTFTVTFATEETAEDLDSGESEDDPDQPHKHRARHASKYHSAITTQIQGCVFACMLDEG